MKRMPVLYVAHAISQPLSMGQKAWQEHYYKVCAFASAIAELRILPSVPVLLPSITHTQALNIDKQIVEDADGIAVYVDAFGWHEASTGVNREIMWAQRANKPVFFDLKDIKKWRRHGWPVISNAD